MSKKSFCSFNEHKIEFTLEEVTMKIDEDFMLFKKENENDDLEDKYIEQKKSERNQKFALMRFDEQTDEKDFTAFMRVHAEIT